MTPEEKNPKADGRTVRAARNALAKKQISQESYRAVLRSELTIQEARELGRSGSPDSPQSPSDDQERVTEISERQPPLCICGCSRRPKSSRSRFIQGHDAVARSKILRALREGEAGTLSPELRAYGVERGLLDG